MRAHFSRCLAATLAAAAVATAAPPAGVPSDPYAIATPYAGCVNHAHAAPAFRWGWFGAERHYPNVQWRRDYNNELMRWSLHRGY